MAGLTPVYWLQLQDLSTLSQMQAVPLLFRTISKHGWISRHKIKQKGMGIINFALKGEREDEDLEYI
jgi:hypothetical protein